MRRGRGRPRIERPIVRGLSALALLLLTAGLFFDPGPCCARPDPPGQPALLAGECCSGSGAGSCPAMFRIPLTTDPVFTLAEGPAVMAEALTAANLSPSGRPPLLSLAPSIVATAAPPPRLLRSQLLI